MLVHIVCWKYKPETDEAEREAHRNKLKALVGVIPEITTFDVGADMLRLERSFDTGLITAFADREALDRYTVHPEHQKVAALGKQIAEKVISVDFLSGDDESGVDYSIKANDLRFADIKRGHI